MEEKIIFPRNLYKSPGSLVWGSEKQNKTYDTVLVENEEGMEIAFKEGYIDDFDKALFGKKEPVKKKVDLDEDF